MKKKYFFVENVEMEEVDQKKEKKVEKKKRKALPKGTASALWRRWIPEQDGIAPCWVGCGSSIHQHAFECGHVISVAEGGNNHLSNLRPICGPCNRAMGTQHMFDYMREHGLTSPYVDFIRNSPYDDLKKYSIWWHEIRMCRVIFQCDLAILMELVNMMEYQQQEQESQESQRSQRDIVLLLYYVLERDAVYISCGISSWHTMQVEYHGGLIQANHPVVCDMRCVVSYEDIPS